MLWIFLAMLTAAVVLALARPLTRPSAGAADASAADDAVYRDQLTEIENDRERGLIGGEEALAARAEVARRLLHLEKSTRPNTSEPQPAPMDSMRVIQGVLAALPIAGVALYLVLGSPGLPGQPLAARQAAPTADSPISELVARVEAELKKNPEDARGWSAIAPVYMAQKRYDDAAYAFSQVMRLKGETVELLLGFAQAALLANKGVVNDGITRAAERVLVLQPDRIEPKAWLALGREQEGDIAGAVTAYKSLIASAPPGAGWLDAVKEQLQRLEGGNASTLAAGPAPGANASSTPSVSRPTAEAIAALPAAEQQKQIAAMVDGLAARLKLDGNDLNGWLRLVRAYQAMGRKDEALAALATARNQFGADPKALSDLDGLARELGL